MSSKKQRNQGKRRKSVISEATRGATEVQTPDQAAWDIARHLGAKLDWVIAVPGEVGGQAWLDEIGLCAIWADGNGTIAFHIGSGEGIRQAWELSGMIGGLRDALLGEPAGPLDTAFVVAIPKDQITHVRLAELLHQPQAGREEQDIIVVGLPGKPPMLPEIFVRAVEIHDPKAGAQLRMTSAFSVN